jgi:hypothetical protein
VGSFPAQMKAPASLCLLLHGAMAILPRRSLLYLVITRAADIDSILLRISYFQHCVYSCMEYMNAYSFHRWQHLYNPGGVMKNGRAVH